MKRELLILFSALSLISTSSVTVTISAQYDNPLLEDLLEKAKEKVAQIKSEYILSNATSEKFSKHLSNITLSQEQIKEVESVRDIILYPCTLINKEYLAIPKDYDNLIISLRTAYANE